MQKDLRHPLRAGRLSDRGHPPSTWCCGGGLKWRLGLLPGLLLLSGCDGIQSTLNSAGVGAERIADLFWWMLGGSVLIWALVIGLAVYATRLHRERHDPVTMRLYIIGGGAVLPTVVLAALLGYGLHLMPELRAPSS